MKRFLTLFVILAFVFSFSACSSSDDNPVAGEDTPAWVGTWLSTGTDIAPILVAVFNYDTVKVTMGLDDTVLLEFHVADGAWGSVPGVYTITESATGDVHSILLSYTGAFDQAGIVQIIEGTPDRMKLEAVQTVPDIGAVPRTPETGFGSDAALGTMNIQFYNKID